VFTQLMVQSASAKRAARGDAAAVPMVHNGVPLETPHRGRALTEGVIDTHLDHAGAQGGSGVLAQCPMPSQAPPTREPILYIHAPALSAPDVPTVPRGGGAPIPHGSDLQKAPARLARLTVHVTEAARRARSGYSPYAKPSSETAKPSGARGGDIGLLRPPVPVLQELEREPLLGPAAALTHAPGPCLERNDKDV
jgi:hypothetical protein